MSYTIKIKLSTEQLLRFTQSEFYTAELGNKLLQDAIERRDLETCKILVSVVDLNNFRSSNTWSLLHFVLNVIESPWARVDHTTQLAMLELFLKAGADPNLLDTERSTPLPQNIELFKLLLNYGMIPMYEGHEMSSYTKRPNPGPVNWSRYLKAINEHNSTNIKCAID
jgi:hypothetical protein